MKKILLLLWGGICVSLRLNAQCSSADFTVSAIKCPDQKISFTNTSANANDGSTYEWDFGDGSPTQPSMHGTRAYAAAGTYQVELIRTCSNSQKQTKKIAVTVTAKPTANNFTFSPTGQCSENAVSFFTTNPTAGMSYSWNFGDPASTSNTSNTKDTVHTFEGYGTGNQTFTVTLTTQDNKGCFDSKSNTVSVKQRPDLQVSELNNYKTCIANIAAGTNADANLFNDTQDPSRSSVTGYTIDWGDGSGVENKTNATFDNNAGATHQYTALNRYPVTITATGSNGCKTTRRYFYLVDANPVANLIGPPSGTNTGCGPLKVTFTNNSSNVSSTTKFFFTPGDGSPTIQLTTGLTGNTISYTYKTSCINGTLQSLTAKLKAENECDSATSTWSPIKVFPQPVADFVAMAPFCKGSPISFVNNSIPNRCAANANTKYTWDFGDGTTPQVFNNVSAALSPQQTLSHNYADTGTYTVVLRAENNSTNGCGFTTDTLVIKISEPPTANFSSSSRTGCAPLDVALSNTSEGIDVGYSWSINQSSGFSFLNGTSASSAQPSLRFTAEGTYIITLIATTPCGTSQKRDTIVVKGKPTIAFPSSPAPQCSPASFTSAAYLPTIGANGGTLSGYLWNFFGGTTSNTNTSNPGAATFSTPGNYAVALRATNECGSTSDTAKSLITVGTPPLANAGKDTAICSGNTVQLGSAAFANHTYSWLPATGLNNPSIANPTATLTNTGIAARTDTLTLTVTANGCNTVKQVKITVNPFPTVSAGTDTSLCKANVSFALSGATPANGTWSGGTFVNANGIFNTSGLAAGTYTVSYTFKDAATKCEATKTKNITIHGLPVVEAGPKINYCNSDSVETLSGFSPAGGTWSGTGVTGAGAFTPSQVGIKTGHQLFYTFVDANSCSATDTLLVDIQAPAMVNMGADEDKCINHGTFTLSNPSPAGGTWETAFYLTASGVFNPKLAGLDTFVVTYTSPGTPSCQAKGSKKVIIKDTVVTFAGSDQVVCANEAVFALSGFLPAGGNWSALPSAYLTGNTFNPSATGLLTSDVPVLLTYTFTDPLLGCTSKDQKTITIKPVPKVDLTAVPTSFCAKDTTFNLGALPLGGVWSGNGIIGSNFNPQTAGTGSHTLKYKIATGNCADSANASITIAPLVKPNAGIDFAICVDAPTKTLSGFSPAGGFWQGRGVIGNDFQPATAGVDTLDLVYTTGTGTCRGSDSVKAAVNPIPMITVGTNPQGVCEGAPAFHLTGWQPNTGGTWAWTGTGITDATLATFDPSVSGAGSFTLTFTYTHTLTGCDDAKTKTVNVNALPALAFSGEDSICTQKPFTISNTSTGTNLVNAWSFDAAAKATFVGSTASSTHPTVLFGQAGIHTIRLIGQTGAGCTDSLKKQVIVLHPPVAKFRKDKNNGCGPLSVTFTNESTGELKDYFWDYGNGRTSTFANGGTMVFQPSHTQDTTYYISLRVTSPVCDDVVFRDSVTVFPKPYVVFGPDKNIGCSPVAIQFKNNTSGRPESFLWNYGDGKPTSTTAESLHTHFFQYLGKNDTTYAVILRATNTCGSDQDTTYIKVLPNTVKAFFNTSTFEGCAPLRVNFTNFSTGGSNVKWELGDGNVTNTVSPSHVYSQPGEYLVTLFVNNGCSFDTTKPAVKIKVNPTPIVKFSPTRTVICEGNELSFNDQSIDIKSYAWSFGDGGSSGLRLAKHVYPIAGTYKIILTGQSATTNCFAKDSASIEVKFAPDAQFGTDTTVGCQPLKVAFRNTSTNSDHYNWFFADGNSSGIPDAGFDYTFEKSGIFKMKLYSFNALGCVDSLEKTITVHPKPQSDFSFNPANSCTYPVRVQTTNTSKGYILSDWTFGNATSSTLNAPFTIYNSVGDYTIRLISTSDKTCKDTANKVFHAYPLPIPSFTATPVSGCQPLLVAFQSTTQHASQFEWDFGDASTHSKLEHPQHVFDKEGVFSVKLKATGNGVCKDSVLMKELVTVIKRPETSFTYVNNNNPVPHGEVQFTNLTSDAISYFWNFGDGTSSTDKDPVHRYQDYGNVLVTLITKNALGCSDTASVLILVDFYKGLWVPTALSPDNGSNEVRMFQPKGRGLAKYKLQIYDAWGIIVWQTEKLEHGSPAEGWDGTGQNGQPLPPDVYVWRATAEFEDGTIWEGQSLNGDKIKSIGTVTLLR